MKSSFESKNNLAQNQAELSLLSFDVIPIEIWEKIFEFILLKPETTLQATMIQLIRFALTCKQAQNALMSYADLLKGRYSLQFPDIDFKLAMNPQPFQWIAYWQQMQKWRVTVDTTANELLEKDTPIQHMKSIIDNPGWLNYPHNSAILLIVNQLKTFSNVFLQYYLHGQQNELDNLFNQFDIYQYALKKFSSTHFSPHLNAHSMKKTFCQITYLIWAVLCHQPLKTIRHHGGHLQLILLFAIKFDYYEIIPPLIQLGAHPNRMAISIADDKNLSNLKFNRFLTEFEAYEASPITLSLLLQNGLYVDDRILYLETSTINAKLLLQAGSIRFLYTPLIFLVYMLYRQRVAMCQPLMRSGVNLSSYNAMQLTFILISHQKYESHKGITPLQIYMLKYLITMGLHCVNINIAEDNSYDFSELNDNLALAELLFEEAFKQAILTGSAEIINALTKKYPQWIYLKGKEGNLLLFDLLTSPLFGKVNSHLFFVTSNCSKDNFQKIILHPNQDGQTILHMAARYNQHEFLKEIFEFNFHNEIVESKELFNCFNDQGYTPLHEAVIAGSVEAANVIAKADRDTREIECENEGWFRKTRDGKIANELLSEEDNSKFSFYQDLIFNAYPTILDEFQEQSKDKKEAITVWKIRSIQKDDMIPEAVLSHAIKLIRKNKYSLAEIEISFGFSQTQQLLQQWNPAFVQYLKSEHSYIVTKEKANLFSLMGKFDLFSQSMSTDAKKIAWFPLYYNNLLSLSELQQVKNDSIAYHVYQRIVEDGMILQHERFNAIKQFFDSEYYHYLENNFFKKIDDEIKRLTNGIEKNCRPLDYPTALGRRKPLEIKIEALKEYRKYFEEIIEINLFSSVFSAHKIPKLLSQGVEILVDDDAISLTHHQPQSCFRILTGILLAAPLLFLPLLIPPYHRFFFFNPSEKMSYQLQHVVKQHSSVENLGPFKTLVLQQLF